MTDNELQMNKVEGKGVEAESVSILRKSKRCGGQQEASVKERQLRGSSGSMKIKALKLSESHSISQDSNVATGRHSSNAETKMTGEQVAGGMIRQVKKAQKPRRRVATLAQRRAANIRERRRMFNLNAAFDRLRKKVPSFAYEKRLSRIETLKLAIMYIRFMDDLVNDDAYAEKYKQLISNSSTSAASSGFLSSGSYLSLYGHCESPSPPTRANSRPLAADGTTAVTVATTPMATLGSNSYKRQTGNAMIASSRQFQIKSEMPLDGKFLPGQYRVRGRLESPATCNSLACCLSPTSSSLTTCHSSSSISCESPTLSPSNQQQQQHIVSSLPLNQDSKKQPTPAYYGESQASFELHPRTQLGQFAVYETATLRREPQLPAYYMRADDRSKSPSIYYGQLGPIEPEREVHIGGECCLAPENHFQHQHQHQHQVQSREQVNLASPACQLYHSGQTILAAHNQGHQASGYSLHSMEAR